MYYAPIDFLHDIYSISSVSVSNLSYLTNQLLSEVRCSKVVWLVNQTNEFC